jgi:hypothetical protein
MTPNEKADELLRKYWNSKFNMHIDVAHECALITVDEIIKSDPTYPWAKDVGAKAQGLYENVIFPTNYWRDVKSELLKMQVKQLNNK